MTICIAVAVFDGIVFAADSASSLVGKNQRGEPVITNVYRNGNKVFNIIRGYPLVAMTCGMGNFGRAPIATVTKDLRRALSTKGDPYAIDLDDYGVEDVTKKALDFFKERYQAINPPPDNPHSFQYWIGGYGSQSDLHEIWSFKIENGVFSDPFRCLTPGDAGIYWGGQLEAIQRLVMGYSPSLSSALVQAGMNEENAAQLLNAITPFTQAPLINPAMPIPDAIELAEFLADTTKRFVRFLPGSDTVGGEIDIATVTRHERFKWIRRKHYYPAKLNPLETDHV